MSTRLSESVIQRVLKLGAVQTLRQSDDGVLLARYTQEGDEVAFTVLVERYGPMVHGTCCRALRSAQDAEDAFQATFLVLATKAGEVRPGSAVGAWLHGIACRVSANLRRENARRARRERVAGERRPPATGAAVTWEEAWSVVDEELQQLPERVRLPLILCYLQGLTRDEAARRLGLTVATLHGRLQRGRDLLRDRLTRRGVTLPAALLVGAAIAPGALAGLSPAVVLSTATTALAYAEGALARDGTSPSRAAALASGASTHMIGTNLKLGALVLALGMVFGGVVLSGQLLPRAGSAPADEPAQQAKQADPPSRFGSDGMRHRDGVHGLAFSADGKVLLTAGADNCFRVWDVGSGRELGRIATGEQKVISATFSRDGKMVAAGGTIWKDGQFRTAFVAAWDVPSGKQVFRTEEPGRAVPRGLALAPDGKSVVMVDGDTAVVWRWDLATGKALAPFHAPGRALRSVEFSPDGKALVAGGAGSGAAHILDVARGTWATFADPPEWISGTFALSPDGLLLATQSGPKVIRLIDVTTGKEVKSLEAPERLSVWALAFTADGKTLAVGVTDGAILWDLASGKSRALTGFPGTVEYLAFTPDGARLAAGGRANAAVVLWDVKTGADLMAKADGHRGSVNTLAFSPDGRTLLTEGADRTVRVWDAETRRQRHVFRAQGPAGLRAALSPDGGTAAVWSDGAVRLWDVGTAKEGRRIEAGDLKYGWGALSFTPKAEKLVGVGGGKGLLVTWDPVKGSEIARRTIPLEGGTEQPGGPLPGPLQGPPAIISAGFTVDGTRCAVTTGADIRILDVASGKVLRVIKGPGSNGIGPLAVSPDGRTVTAGLERTGSYELGLWELGTGRELGRLPIGGTFEHVTAVAFSADGRFVAAASGFGRSVIVCEVASRKEVLTLRGHESFVNALTFSPDGSRLAAALRDTTVFAWNLSAQAAPVADAPGAAWEALRGLDAPAAYKARWALLARPAEAVALLGKNLRPVPAPDEKTLARLIADLDSDDFVTRERATADLEKLGDTAEPSVRAALAGKPSPEANRRLIGLLNRLSAAPPADALREVRAVAVLESLGTRDARLALEAVAKGAPGARLTREAKEALERLDTRPAARR